MVAEEVAVGELGLAFSPRIPRIDLEHARVLATRWVSLAPILVQLPRLLVIDGAHRLVAARLLGRRTVAVEVFDGDDLDALVEAIERRTHAGKPLTMNERAHGVSRLLAAAPNWSDRRIAAICAVSPKTVARRRAPDPAVAGRVGRDGRMRPLDPCAVRQAI